MIPRDRRALPEDAKLRKDLQNRLDGKPILRDKSDKFHQILLSRRTCFSTAHHPRTAHRPHALCLQLLPLLNRENPPDRQ